MILQLVKIVIAFLVVRFLSKTSLFHILKKCWQSVEDRFYTHQFYKVPQYDGGLQQNQLYLKVSSYLNTLPSLEDTDFTNLSTGSKSHDILLHVDRDHNNNNDQTTIKDRFLRAKVSWVHENKTWVLKIRRNDKHRVLRPYMQHILSVADDIDQRKKDIRLFMNLGCDDNHGNERWRSVLFTHPSTFDTIVMQNDLKNRVKSDLEQFLKSKHYYHRLGRVWKRSYLLYGASGTGKSSFIAAMARFLCYDVYDINMGNVRDDSDLKLLLLQTTPRSMIVIEDLDRLLVEIFESTALTLSGLLNFMDGIMSCCGEERVMVFTMNGNDKNKIDQAVLRPGRIDVHIEFPPCDFSTFKVLASSCLGVKEHKLFSQIEEIFQNGSSLSPSEISEIMISNRNSSTRALKCVITALHLQANVGEKSRFNQALSKSRSARTQDVASENRGLFCKENVNFMKDFKTLYGFLRVGSKRREELSDLDHSFS